MNYMKKIIAIVDSRISNAADRKLTLCGFTVIKLPPYSKLSTPVASHPDMLIHRLGNTLISYADYCEEVSYIFSDLSTYAIPSGYNMRFADDNVSAEYPNDTRLNALNMNGMLFSRCESASQALLECARRAGLTVVTTKQGYPACTVMKLTESSAITADQGMAKILLENGIRVTLIDILLPPYEYGFIGGCGGTFDKKVYLFGDPMLHRDGEKIIDAIRSEGLDIISLDTSPLVDLGGILFIECEVK